MSMRAIRSGGYPAKKKSKRQDLLPNYRSACFFYQRKAQKSAFRGRVPSCPGVQADPARPSAARLGLKRTHRFDSTVSPFEKLNAYWVGAFPVRSPNHPSVLRRIATVLRKDKRPVARGDGKQQHLPEGVRKAGTQARSQHRGGHHRLLAAQLCKLNHPPFVSFEAHGNTR